MSRRTGSKRKRMVRRHGACLDRCEARCRSAVRSIGGKLTKAARRAEVASCAARCVNEVCEEALWFSPPFYMGRVGSKRRG